MLCKVETNRFSDYLPLYQSGEATLGSDEYYQYDVYSIRVASRYGANPVPPTREDYHHKLLKLLGSGRDNFDFSLEEGGEAPGCLLQLGSGIFAEGLPPTFLI